MGRTSAIPTKAGSSYGVSLRIQVTTRIDMDLGDAWQPRAAGNHPNCSPGYSSNAEVCRFSTTRPPAACRSLRLAEILSFDLGTSFAETPYPATTGCDQLAFNPSLFVQPTTQQTDSASGSDVNLKVPQETSPSVPSGSEIRALSVELPPGFTLTPNASDGKVACTEAEAEPQ